MISVIIPLYNKAAFIRRALESVFAQTHPAAEIVVVDDGSSDGSGKMVRQFQDYRLRLLSQHNQGVSAARNRGTRAATQPMLAFLDADDEWMPDHLSTLARLGSHFPEAGLLAASYLFSSEDGRRRTPRICGLPESADWEGILPSYFDSASNGDPPITASTACVKKSALEDVGGFPIGLRAGEDLDTWVRVALKHPIAFSKTVTAIYHLASNGAASSFDPAELSMVSRWLAFESGPNRRALENYVVWRRTIVATKLIVQGESKRAREILSAIRGNHAIRRRRKLLFGSMLPHCMVRVYTQLQRHRTARDHAGLACNCHG
jgi:glycosyltransferase involved in cell wall biosynthesis